MGDPGVPRRFAGQGKLCARLPSCFSPGARQTRTPWGHYSTPHAILASFGGSEVGVSTEKHELVQKVARWLPQACRIGAVEAVVWVRGRCLGGTASFLDKDGCAFIVAIQEQKYYVLFGPSKRTEIGKKWGIRLGGSLEHGKESLLELSNVPVHPLELPLNPFLTGVGKLSYPTSIWVPS